MDGDCDEFCPHPWRIRGGLDDRRKYPGKDPSCLDRDLFPGGSSPLLSGEFLFFGLDCSIVWDFAGVLFMEQKDVEGFLKYS